ncbi:MAG: NAD-dependent malic enzyme [Sandaracinaceae bacterium]|nr:NAD-dependent malic enzyme [Sandaracinaceae bacterium]
MAKLSRYFETFREPDGTEKMRVFARGHAVLRLAATNKGSAFTEEERIALGLEGLLPPRISTLSDQLVRVRRAYLEQPTPLAKYQFLRSVQERNELLFYALLEEHLAEMLPIIYTPTVGDAVQGFSLLYQSPRGLSLSTRNIDRAKDALASTFYDDVRMIVATDSSAILGIGDQGYGGLAIAIGKLALYTAGGGVSPSRTLPVGLDVGTDRVELREHPSYLGVPHARLRGEPYLAFVDKFVEAVRARYPRAIVQWEDLSKDTAFTVLERYRKVLPSFNDDIQGTGAVALAGVLSACKLRGERLVDQRIIVYGAGAGGAGVAWAMRDGMMREGLSRAEALSRLYVLDSKGLLLEGRAMEDYKRTLARPVADVADWGAGDRAPDLLCTIEKSGATVLLGLSGQSGAFTEAHVRALARNAERPIVFPLSNPTSACEASPEDILRWSEQRAIVATGSPFAPVRRPTGELVEIGQGNNAFIFPGLGFGAILCNAREITDGMVMAASQALSDYTARVHLRHGLVYPPVSELREVSIAVAVAVIVQAYADGVATSNRIDREAIEAHVRRHFWRPHYLPFVAG